MKASNLLIGIGIGACIGYLVSTQLKELKISPDAALKKVKKVLLDSEEAEIDNINGSWIQTKTEKYVKQNIPYEVYKGGISGKNDGFERQYNFKIDAKTGTIIELQPENI